MTMSAAEREQALKRIEDEDDYVVEWISPPDAVTAAADVHTGAMIALVPAGEYLSDLTVPGGEPEDQLHLTLVYLGDAVDFGDQERQDIRDGIAHLADHQPIVEGDLFGVAMFNPLGDEPCIVMLCGGEMIPDVCMSACEELDRADIMYPELRMPFIPHITLMYIDPSARPITGITEFAEKTGPIVFDRLRVAFGGEVNDYPLNESIVADAFHLAGQHNQQTHGRGGATPAELDAGRRLNAGKQLDLNDPEQARISHAIGVWSTGGNDGGALALEMQDAVHNPDADTAGASLMRTIAGAPADAPTLHRGMAHVAPDAVPKAGDVFELGPTSFTRSTKVRDIFAAHASGPSSFGHETQVHMTVKPGSRALRIDHEQSLHPDYAKEQEHIGMGKYRVTKYKEREVTIKTTSGVKKTVTRYEVEVEQVPDTLETTIKTNKPSVQTDEWWGN